MKKILGTILVTAGVLGLLVYWLHTPDISLAVLKEKYTNAASRFMRINGMEVHYRDEGPRTDALPILLLHGTASSLHTWDSLVPLFPEKRMIRLDLPGYGLTGPHPQADYRSVAYAQVFDTLLQRLRVDSCIVAGNSLGGFLAWTYVLHNPQVRGLVLIDAGGFSIGKPSGNLGFRIARTPVVNQLVKYITPRSLFRKSLEQSFGNPTYVTDAMVTKHYELTLRPGNRQALLDRVKKFEKADTDALNKVHIPVLILWGAKDQIIPVAHATLFEKLLPKSTKIIYPHLGHVPMEEEAARLAEDMRKWMGQNRNTR